MGDTCVKLHEVAPDHALIARLEKQQISIRRTLSPNKRRVISFVDRCAESHWPQEPGCRLLCQDGQRPGDR
jgi:hypothetical protein